MVGKLCEQCRNIGSCRLPGARRAVEKAQRILVRDRDNFDANPTRELGKAEIRSRLQTTALVEQVADLRKGCLQGE